MNYLKLIRYKNLIFIAVLLILMNFCIVKPILQAFAIDPSAVLPDFIFWLLTIGVVLISAGGYAINDYFDTRIDLLNRPDKLIVGHSITKDHASLVHHVTTAAGLICGIVASVLIRSVTTGLIFVMVAGLLWFYSASYKRQFIVGNVIIALLTGLTPILIAIVHHAYLGMESNYGTIISQTPVPMTIYTVTCCFGLFAFLLTLMREIVKDMQDEYGDRESECRTIPIVIGDSKTKIILYIITAVTAILSVKFSLSVNDFPLLSTATVSAGYASLRYAVIGIVVPLVAFAVLLFRAKSPADYGNASALLKFIMAVGTLYSLVFYFLLCKIQGLMMFGIFMVAAE